MEKKSILTRALISLCLGASLTLVACGDSSKDEPENPNKPVNPNTPVADPDDTVAVNLLVGMNKERATDLGGGIKVYVDAGYNLCAYNYSGAEIIDIGKVSGLGNITTIPATGWKEKAAIVVGHGYVLRCVDSGIYARLYVAETMISTTDAIMGYTVKYQCPMMVSGLIYPINLKSAYVTFDAYRDLTYEIGIISGNELQVKSKPYWCEVEIDPAETKLKLTVEPNETQKSREGIIVIANPKFETEVRVKQNW